MLLDHLYATPYTTTAGDRTSDLLGWRRMRTAWQRRLFPMFTVLTWSRDFAEISLAMRVAALDCDRRGDLEVLRDLEVLFGLASLEAPDPNRTGNPLGILNIERIRDYREAHKGRPLCVSESYIQNLGYGIGPHYGSALRGFGLIDVNNRPVFEDELHGPMLPSKQDRKTMEEIARRWFSEKEGLRKGDLRTLYLKFWKPLAKTRDETRKGRTKAWKHLVLSGERFTKPEFAYFRTLAVEAFELFKTQGSAENAAALRCSVLAHIETKGPESDLARHIRAGHAFEVATGWADLLMDALVCFAGGAGNARTGESADPSAPGFSSTTDPEAPSTLSTLTAFFELHPRSLPVLCQRLLDARWELLRWDDGDANDFRTFLADCGDIAPVPTTPACEARDARETREATFAVLRALVRRHMRQKGMQASVRIDDDGERLVASGPAPAYVGASVEVFKRLDAEGADIKALTAVSPLADSLSQPLSTPDAQPETEADRLMKNFIGINGTWRIFANWFELVTKDAATERLEAEEAAEEDDLQ